MRTPRNRIYKVVFNPEISTTCKEFILNEIPESYSNGSCFFYSISFVLEGLKEEIAGNNNTETSCIKKEDITELERLMEYEQVSAIELL